MSYETQVFYFDKHIPFFNISCCLFFFYQKSLKIETENTLLKDSLKKIAHQDPLYENPVADTEKTVSPKNPYKNSDIKIVIIGCEDATFGYDIFIDGQLMIYQPNIPGIPGNRGFKNKADAEKVSGKIVAKIRNNQMPPTLNNEELKQLKVI